jgi:hypothetical protein
MSQPQFAKYMKTSYMSCTAHNCKKTFRNQDSLKKHLENDHSDTENSPLVGYRCRKCRRVLGTKQCLKEHLYTHTGQKPYKCIEPGCGKVFRQSSQLSYHKKVHSELKRFYLKNTADSNGGSEETGTGENRISKEWTDTQADPYKLPEICGPCFGVRLPNLFS